MIPSYSFKPFQFIPCDTEPASAPKARSGHRIVCDESNLYSFGGYNPSEVGQQLFVELWKFNFATSKWKMLECEGSLPTEVASHTVLLDSGTMMIFGGTGYPFGLMMSNNLHLCDLRAKPIPTVNVIRGGEQGGAPMEQYGQAMVLMGKYLYVIGGTTGYEYSSDVHRLDFSTKTWEVVYLCHGNEDVEPKGRYRHELASYGERIFVLGGGTSDTVFGFKTISAFNTSTRKWEKIHSRHDRNVSPTGYPRARRSHACVQIDTEDSSGCQVFISGGHDSGKALDDIWRLEIPSMQWTMLTQCRMPLPVFFHSAAVTPSGRMYTFGGIVKCEDGQDRRTSEVDAIWLRIPKLSAICWEAINHYSPNLNRFTDKKLYESGIPFKCIQHLS